ncbi:hypothetical protein [Poriferisphaera sp. WC338]|uniref:hypothetical protein n=1 Tax=Poriferisphaera sp. WC338 TaxID=3425129 RepID=UPI003D81B739
MSTTTPPSPAPLIIEAVARLELEYTDNVVGLIPLPTTSTSQLTSTSPPSRMLLAIDPLYFDLWDVLVYYWPPILLIITIPLAFIFAITLPIQLAHNRQTPIGKRYCKKCNANLNNLSLPATCPSCSKTIHLKHTAIRKPFHKQHPIFLSLCLFVWLTPPILIPTLYIEHQKHHDPDFDTSSRYFADYWRWRSILTAYGHARHWLDIPIKPPLEFHFTVRRSPFYGQFASDKYEFRLLTFDPKTKTISSQTLHENWYDEVYTMQSAGESWDFGGRISTIENTDPFILDRGDNLIIIAAGQILRYDKPTSTFTTIPFKQTPRLPFEKRSDEYQPDPSDPTGKTFFLTPYHLTHVYDLGHDLILITSPANTDKPIIDDPQTSDDYKRYAFLHTVIVDLKTQQTLYENLHPLDQPENTSHEYFALKVGSLRRHHKTLYPNLQITHPYSHQNGWNKPHISDLTPITVTSSGHTLSMNELQDQLTLPLERWRDNEIFDMAPNINIRIMTEEETEAFTNTDWETVDQYIGLELTNQSIQQLAFKIPHDLEDFRRTLQSHFATTPDQSYIWTISLYDGPAKRWIEIYDLSKYVTTKTNPSP